MFQNLNFPNLNNLNSWFNQNENMIENKDDLSSNEELPKFDDKDITYISPDYFWENDEISEILIDLLNKAITIDLDLIKESETVSGEILSILSRKSSTTKNKNNLKEEDCIVFKPKKIIKKFSGRYHEASSNKTISQNSTNGTSKIMNYKKKISL